MARSRISGCGCNPWASGPSSCRPAPVGGCARSPSGASPRWVSRGPAGRPSRPRARPGHRWKPSSLKTFDIYLRNRLMPHFGRVRLDAITHARVWVTLRIRSLPLCRRIALVVLSLQIHPAWGIVQARASWAGGPLITEDLPRSAGGFPSHSLGSSKPSRHETMWHEARLHGTTRPSGLTAMAMGFRYPVRKGSSRRAGEPDAAGRDGPP